MNTYVSFLRGINVGGNNKIPMAELRRCLQDAGFEDVATYIASGNVMFEAAATEREVGAAVAAAIADCFELEIPVVVRTATELDALRKSNPFAAQAAEDPKKVHVYFFDAMPDGTAIHAALADYDGPEQVELSGRDLYGYFPEGLGRSKFPFAKIERSAGARATGRNWNTVEKLCQLLSARKTG